MGSPCRRAHTCIFKQADGLELEEPAGPTRSFQNPQLSRGGVWHLSSDESQPSARTLAPTAVGPGGRAACLGRIPRLNPLEALPGISFPLRVDSEVLAAHCEDVSALQLLCALEPTGQLLVFTPS